MRFDGFDDLVRQRRALGRGAKGAVAHAAPGAPGDLRDLGGRQTPGAVTVELAQAGEGDVIDVHVEAHADGVRRHQEVHLPLLIQRHLSVPRSRAEAAHDHGAAAFTAADQFGDGVDLGGAERDHGGARRQSHKLRRTGIGQLRQPRAGFDQSVRHQTAQQRADGLGAEEHGLDHAARVQQALGEHMAAVGVGAKLDFVHRDELDMAVERHRLHRAGEPFGVGRDDLFLASDEGDVVDAFTGDHAVVVLTRQ